MSLMKWLVIRLGLAVFLFFFAVTMRPALMSSADIVLYASEAPVKAGNWTVVTDSSAAGGARIANPNQGAAKIATARANPTDYFEMTFNAEAGQSYRLWIRGKAENDYWGNDSVHVQFSGSVNSSGTAIYRIGSTNSAEVNLEDCSGCGLSGWGWQDNGWGVGVMGPLVYFQATGTQTIRIQTREDGFSIDQIVLSPGTYLNTSPGALKNDTTILPKTSGGGTPITLVRQPYLQQVTSTSAVVVWATREAGAGEVRHWVNGGQVITTGATSTFFPATVTGMAFDYYQYEARLTSLTSATTYAYDIYVSGSDATPGVTDGFTTAPAVGTGTVRFIAFGDSGIGSTEQRQLAALMESESFDFSLHAGDVVYGASNTTGGASYPQYHNWFFSIYSSWLRSRPVFPSIGNHDDQINSARAYRDLFVLPENGASATFPDHGERYYSFDYGPVHFVALDTELAFQNTSRRQAQLDWLAADLSTTQQPWRVVFFHRSPYSSGDEHGSELAVRQAFGPIFEQHRVQLVISGHDHDFERSVPWRESPTGTQAVTYVVTGAGGARLYNVGQNAWTAVSRSAYHYVRGYIAGCQLIIEAVGLDGRVFDQFTLDKCVQAADAASPTVSIITPNDGATVSGSIQVQTQASDDKRVEKVDLWIDGSLYAIDVTSPYEFLWDSNMVVNGPHTIEARAYDIAGNRASSGVRTIHVSNGSNPVNVVLYASEAPVKAGNWTVVTDSTAAGGARIANPNQGAAKIATARANPTDYFEMTFNVEAGQAYRLWIRGKAENDYWGNDSVHVQFSGSVNSSGTAIYRIGSTSGAEVNLEDCSGCGLSGWGWQDNGWGVGVMGPLIYFATTGTQTIRVQTREDGFSIDQIVLSPGTYLNSSPGMLKNDSTILQR